MDELRTVAAVLLGCITVGGLIMAFARTPFEDAKRNLATWVAATGLTILSKRLRGSDFRALVNRSGTILSVAGATLLSLSVRYFEPSHQAPEIPPDVKQQLSTLKDENGSLKSQLAAQSERQLPPKSTFLNIDDVDRWRISNALRDQTINAMGGSPCQARVFEKPNDTSATTVSQETIQLIRAAGWHLEGGRTSKTVFPDGITISTTRDNGGPFLCAYRLTEMLEGLHLRPIDLRVNVATPDLIECKECVEVTFGTTARPKSE